VCWRGADRAQIAAGRVVLTTGTFLRGLIHLGEIRIPAGRARTKGGFAGWYTTQTPARGTFDVTRAGCNHSVSPSKTPQDRNAGRAGRPDDGLRLAERQDGDTPPAPFSYLTGEITTPQIRPLPHHETTPATHR
jgi:tRNA uridine 5-carboxymethylaminomethyl modification enzyme